MDDQDSQPQPRRRRGEKFPGGRDAILTVAREQFARLGYEQTTIRGVAKQAGVDARLVMHFFATKEELFAGAVTIPEQETTRLLGTLALPRDDVALALTRAYVALWEDPATATQIRAVVRSASTNDEGARILRDTLERRIADVAAPHYPRTAVATAMAQLLGASIGRYILRVPALADLSPEELVTALVGPVDASLHPRT